MSETDLNFILVLVNIVILIVNGKILHGRLNHLADRIREIERAA